MTPSLPSSPTGLDSRTATASCAMTPTYPFATPPPCLRGETLQAEQPFSRLAQSAAHTKLTLPKYYVKQAHESCVSVRMLCALGFLPTGVHTAVAFSPRRFRRAHVPLSLLLHLWPGGSWRQTAAEVLPTLSAQRALRRHVGEWVSPRESRTASTSSTCSLSTSPVSAPADRPCPWR